MSYASSGDLPRPKGMFVKVSCEFTALTFVTVWLKSCVYPQSRESLFSHILWSSCIQALLAFKAKCSGIGGWVGGGWGVSFTDASFRVQNSPSCGRTSGFFFFFQFMGCLLGRYRICLYCKNPSCHLILASSLSFGVECFVCLFVCLFISSSLYLSISHELMFLWKKVNSNPPLLSSIPSSF